MRPSMSDADRFLDNAIGESIQSSLKRKMLMGKLKFHDHAYACLHLK